VEQRRRARGLVLVALGLMLVFPNPAAGADDRVEEARAHYMQGNAYYRLDKFREALGEYELAYIAKPDPSFLYNIAQCHRLMGNRADALKFYRRFIKDQVSSPNRSVAEKHIRDIERAGITTVPPHTSSGPAPAAGPAAGPSPAAAPPPAFPAQGGAAPAAAPPPLSSPPLALAPPPSPSPSPLNAPAPGALPSDSDDRPAPPDEGAPSPPFYKSWWFWTAVGVVLVAGTVAVVATRNDDPCEQGRMCR
jgi:hypothetical protein